MLLRHVTLRRNLKSIFGTGLQPGLARGKRKAVWLVRAGKQRWAKEHVARRHRVDARSIIVLVVDVSRGQLRRGPCGTWYCPDPITPEQIVSVGGLKIFTP
jgi:hypothetical protein